MDGFLVRRFIAAHRDALLGGVVHRALPLADGLVLSLQSRDRTLELAVSIPSGAAWAWCLQRSERVHLLEEIAAAQPALADPVPTELEWRAPDATPLDALRVWLLRPGPQQPGWSLLEGARLTDLQQRGSDRILVVDLERHDGFGTRETLHLTAQLFDRAANLILANSAGAELANLRGRPPARERGVPLAPEGRPNGDDAGAESLAAAAHLSLGDAATEALVTTARRALRRQETRLETLLAKLDTEEQAASEAQGWRRLGDLLSANLHRVRRGQSRVTVQDLYAEGAPRDIELDPERSPQENVALFFKRARRGERGHAMIAARRATERSRLQALRAQRERLESCRHWEDVLRAAPDVWRSACPPSATRLAVPALWNAGGPDWPSAQRATQASAPEPEGPGRRFLLPGGWEVRVGRNNAENDLLTHRFARPDDIWMHASGVSGSHLVLRMQGRSGNPPRGVLEMAAAIAARFSQAKHAGTVPVIWTRKRYVRKPRGGAPGLAQCTHEKSLFVRPGLPERDSDASSDAETD